jgi:hypothetical protein
MFSQLLLAAEPVALRQRLRRLLKGLGVEPVVLGRKEELWGCF